MSDNFDQKSLYIDNLYQGPPGVAKGVNVQAEDFMDNYFRDKNKSLPHPGSVIISVPKRRSTLFPLANQEMHCMKALVVREMETCQSILDQLGNGGITEKTTKATRNYLKLRQETLEVMISVVERLAQVETLESEAVVKRTTASLRKTLDVANG